MGEGDVRLAVEPDGTYEVSLAAPNLDNTEQISIRSAIRAAEDVAAQHGVATDDLAFDRLMLQYEAGGTSEGDGTLREPVVTETIVQFTQMIDGVPVLAPGRGQLSVGIDNDGRPTKIRNTVRPIAEVTERGRRTPPVPEAEAVASVSAPSGAELDEAGWVRGARAGSRRTGDATCPRSIGRIARSR